MMQYKIKQKGWGFQLQLTEVGSSVKYAPKMFPDKRTAIAYGEYIIFKFSK